LFKITFGLVVSQKIETYSPDQDVNKKKK